MRFSEARDPICYCQACGKTVSLNEKFCVGCGAVLGDIQCPKCGHLGPPFEFKEGCPNCLYLNAKGNTSSGIIRVNTLKKAYGKDKKEAQSQATSSGNKKRSYSEKNEPFPTSFFTNLLLLVLLSFGILGGLWWLSQ